MELKDYLNQLTSVPGKLTTTLKDGAISLGKVCKKTNEGERSVLATPFVLIGVWFKTSKEVHRIVFETVTSGFDVVAEGLDSTAEWVDERVTQSEVDATLRSEVDVTFDKVD